MGYFRRGRPAAGQNANAAVNRVASQTPLHGAEYFAEDGRMPMDTALLRLLTQLANCGLDACAPPLLRIQA